MTVQSCRSGWTDFDNSEYQRERACFGLARALL